MQALDILFHWLMHEPLCRWFKTDGEAPVLTKDISLVHFSFLNFAFLIKISFPFYFRFVYPLDFPFQNLSSHPLVSLLHSFLILTFPAKVRDKLIVRKEAEIQCTSLISSSRMPVFKAVPYYMYHQSLGEQFQKQWFSVFSSVQV